MTKQAQLNPMRKKPYPTHKRNMEYDIIQIRYFYKICFLSNKVDTCATRSNNLILKKHSRFHQVLHGSEGASSGPRPGKSYPIRAHVTKYQYVAFESFFYFLNDIAYM